MVLFFSPLKSSPKMKPKSYAQLKSYLLPEEDLAKWVQAGGSIDLLNTPYLEG